MLSNYYYNWQYLKNELETLWLTEGTKSQAAALTPIPSIASKTRDLGGCFEVAIRLRVPNTISHIMT